jgi:primary-amine oxidase
MQVDAVPMPSGSDNPHCNGFTAVETDLTSTEAAQRLTAPDKGRIWKIKNPAVLNPVTHKPVAYKLMPMATPTLLASPESVVGKRAVFASKNLWVSVCEGAGFGV